MSRHIVKRARTVRNASEQFLRIRFINAAVYFLSHSVNVCNLVAQYISKLFKWLQYRRQTLSQNYKGMQPQFKLFPRHIDCRRAQTAKF